MPGQFPQEYRDARTSVSELDSMTDQSLHPPMDLLPDNAIDPRLDEPSDLAGLAGDTSLPFGQFTLEDGIPEHNITQTSPFTGIQGTERSINLSPEDVTGPMPWTSYQVNNTMKRQPSQCFRSPSSQSKRIRPNSNGPSPRSQDQTTFSQYSSSPTGSNQLLQGSSSQQNSFFSMTHDYDGQQPPCLQSLEHRPSYVQQSSQTSLPQFTSPPQRRAAGKAPRQLRNQDRKHQCDDCGPGEKVFKTVNDLDRHRRTVHGIINPGSRVWKCNMAGCTVSDKIWARLDNFKQHVVRMHGTEHGEVADGMWVEYRPEVHGLVEVSKCKRGSGSRHSNVQELPSPSASVSTANNVAVRRTGHQSLGALNDTQLQALTRQQTRSGLRSTQTSLANNPGSRLSAGGSGSASTSIASADHNLQRHYGMPFLHPTASTMLDHNMPRQRRAGDSYTMAGHETYIRQQAELQKQDDTNQGLPLMGSATAEFDYLGQVMEDNGHAITVHPADLSTQEPGYSGAKHTILLMPAAKSSETGVGDALQSFIDGLPEEHRHKFYEACNPDILKELGNTPRSNRSVSKTLSKGKKADAVEAQKTLKCTRLVEVDGKNEQCQKAFNRHSELRKHEKRHDKRYGCTFDHCYKRFGTKWEWKRHEHDQHVQLESWRCRKKGHSPGQCCAQLFNDKNDFSIHIQSQHGIVGDSIAQEIDACRLAKKWLGSFWCGFCIKIIKSTAPFGPEMDKERNEHVSKHIELHDDSSQEHDMWEWIELAGKGRTKEQMKKADANASLKHNDKAIPSFVDVEDDEEETSGSEQAAEPESNEAYSQHPRPVIDTNVVRADREPLDARTARDRRRSSANTPTVQLISPSGDISTPTSTNEHGNNSQRRARADRADNVNLEQFLRQCCQCSMQTRVRLGLTQCPYCNQPYCPACKLRGPKQQQPQPQHWLQERLPQQTQQHFNNDAEDDVPMEMLFTDTDTSVEPWNLG